MLRRHVIEDKIDTSFPALVHHTVLLLVVDLVDRADSHPVRAAVDHEAHPVIGVDGDMDTVAVVKGGVLVAMRLDNAAGTEPRRHGANNASPRRIVIGQYPVHERQRLLRQHVPARFPAHLDIGPAGAVGKYHDDGLGLLVYLVRLLAIGIAKPY